MKLERYDKEVPKIAPLVFTPLPEQPEKKRVRKPLPRIQPVDLTPLPTRREQFGRAFSKGLNWVKDALRPPRPRVPVPVLRPALARVRR